MFANQPRQPASSAGLTSRPHQPASSAGLTRRPCQPASPVNLRSYFCQPVLSCQPWQLPLLGGLASRPRRLVLPGGLVMPASQHRQLIKAKIDSQTQMLNLSKYKNNNFPILRTAFANMLAVKNGTYLIDFLCI